MEGSGRMPKITVERVYDQVADVFQQEPDAS
jgi:hypothetical protein